MRNISKQKQSWAPEPRLCDGRGWADNTVHLYLGSERAGDPRGDELIGMHPGSWQEESCLAAPM